MYSGRKTSVATQLSVAILAAITLSWLLATVTTNYLAFRDVRAMHAYMLQHPELYPRPFPEPRLDLPILLGGAGRALMGPPPTDRGPGPPGPPMAPGDDRTGPDLARGRERRPERPVFPVRDTALRLIISLGLALIAGTWLSWRLTRPLADLAEGAKAISRGQFDRRIGEQNSQEYADLAAAMNEMAARVSAQIEGLQEEAGRRRQLLADVAHELRGPVTTIGTMAGALAEDIASDPDRRAQAQEAMVRASGRLRRLIDDLLDLAKLDLRELPLHLEEFDLRALASEAVGSHTDAAAAARVRLEDMESGPPVMVRADPGRIAQILDNLIGNAISYSGEGSKCRVSLLDEDPVRLVVQDTGAGIPEEHLPYVFDAFYRADLARTPSGEHSGLGLRIARALAEAHGGTLTIRSRSGVGTSATVALPKSGSPSRRLT